MTARLMLERKGIPYKRRDLIYVVSKGWLRAAGFPGVTLPALKLDGERVQGSTAIARELERVKPEPPLFPTDPQRRAAVEEAEGWGAEFLQPRVRRILWWGFKRDRSSMDSYLEGARLGLPTGLAAKTAAPIVALSARFNKADDEHVAADFAALPGDLDRIEKWISEGVLGGDQPNAADFQIATSVRLLMTLEDLLPVLETRTAGEFAKRVVPDFPGRLSPVYPAEWLAGLRT
jgi:glutathione S-transferase